MALPSVGGGYQFGDGNLSEIDIVSITPQAATVTATLTVAQVTNSVLVATAGTAAKICGSIDINGYADWYLPSTYELTKIYENLASYDMANFTTYAYHTSTEYTIYNSGYIIFANGQLWTGNSNPYGSKDDVYNVRAARSF